MKSMNVLYRTAVVVLAVGLIGVVAAWQISGWATAMAFDGVSRQLPTDGNGEIHGRITGDTGNPIAGVRILLLLTSNNSYVGDSETDANGVYALTNLPLASYKICTEASTSASSQYFHRCLDTPIILSEATPVQQNVDMVLLSGAHISGRITNEAGEPIKDIEIRIYFQVPGQVGQMVWTPFNSIYSDADGNYTLQRITAGTYRLCVMSNRHYIGECYNDVANVDSAQDITIADNQYLSGYDFQLPLGGSITGSVSYKDGQLVPWGQINTYQAFQESNGSITWGSVGSPYYIQENGLYTITGLATGTYRLQVENPYPGQLPFVGEYYNDAYTLDTATDIPVQIRQTVPNINFQVGKNGVIHGHVSDRDGQALDQISVSAGPIQAGGNGAGAATDVNGNYTITLNAAGTYRIGFSESVPWGSSGRGYAPEYYNDSITPEGATPLSIEPDAVINGIDAVLGHKGGISGKVMNIEGKPIPLIDVRLYNQFFQLGFISTDGNGEFSFPTLDSDIYRICVGELQSVKEYESKCFTEISVTPDITVPIVVTLERLGGIAGTVTSVYNAPLQNAYVTLYGDNSSNIQIASTMTDANGQYKFDRLSSSRPFYMSASVVSQDGGAYQMEYYDDKETLENATPITVLPDQITTANLQLAFLPNTNAPPYARNDAIWVSQVATSTHFTSGEISILSNDQDFENSPLQITLTKLPTHGTLELADSGVFTYVHDSSNTVFDSFTYHVNDGKFDSNSATVSIILPGAKNLFLPLVER